MDVYAIILVPKIFVVYRKYESDFNNYIERINIVNSL